VCRQAPAPGEHLRSERVGGLLEGVASAGVRVGAGTPGEARVGSVEEERGARVTAAAVSHCKDGWKSCVNLTRGCEEE
jgi:hypothetical protein